jgi:hypothetical protein
MATHRIQRPATCLSGLITYVHWLATGRELQLNDALDYFRDPARLTSVVERGGILADSSKHRRLKALLTESRHGV